MSKALGDRIEANCKIIWGNDSEYDIDTETDDYVNYLCCVRKDFGTKFGPPLTITDVCGSSEAAWAELDRMLRLWANVVKRGTPMTKDEKLEIFSGPEGDRTGLLSRSIDKFDRLNAKMT
ncbi:hypothetical protein AOQ84DRAFT_390256 [Glonium stellatum]|uniref:Uncharacterized protein n=1 Tax=Glonium stellatum TaxID=574774 RepID=A0A8E2JR27_9PEZI|nr:hypothetical protein AOQ84DRAFT_390256 [Glonium stellatum]